MVMEVVMINTEAEAKTELHVWAQSRVGKEARRCFKA